MMYLILGMTALLLAFMGVFMIALRNEINKKIDEKFSFLEADIKSLQIFLEIHHDFLKMAGNRIKNTDDIISFHHRKTGY